ncbi:MAG: bifunctional DNA-formamidopyrimidine glycosylase/DNA-(apurinic or apyrimidinic site) lyase [Bryobacteraceae bacterium]
MPELPEVETIVRSLAPRIEGRSLLDAGFSSRFVVRDDFETLSAHLRGRKIHKVERRGKFILFQLDCGALSIHLGMTGKLLLDATPGPYTRAWFRLDDGILLYDDIRQFGRIEWSPGIPPRIAALGPEPLEAPFDLFFQRLKDHRGVIKPLLLNQKFLRGLGNIYVDESLFAARIHPRALASRLSAKRAGRLHRAIRDLLQLAIAHKGSSISDYVDTDGRKGNFQSLHKVYGREGQPCFSCGSAIRRIVIAQRGTHYCPRCQRA